MKKVFLLALILMLISVPVSARRQTIVVTLKTATDREDISGTDMGTGNHYTLPISIHDAVSEKGAIAFIGHGDIDITYELSMDNATWYTPKVCIENSEEIPSGTCESVATIGTAISSKGYYMFTQQVANYIRFNFDPDAASDATAYYIYQAGD